MGFLDIFKKDNRTQNTRAGQEPDRRPARPVPEPVVREAPRPRPRPQREAPAPRASDAILRAVRAGNDPLARLAAGAALQEEIRIAETEARRTVTVVRAPREPLPEGLSAVFVGGGGIGGNGMMRRAGAIRIAPGTGGRPGGRPGAAGAAGGASGRAAAATRAPLYDPPLPGSLRRANAVRRPARDAAVQVGEGFVGGGGGGRGAAPAAGIPRDQVPPSSSLRRANAVRRPSRNPTRDS